MHPKKTVNPILFVLLIVLSFVSCTKNSSDKNNHNTTDSLEIGLIAHYPFNGNMNDESANNYDLSNQGAILVADRFNKPNTAYYFNGDDARVDIPELGKADSLRDFAISFWAKTDRAGSLVSFFSDPQFNCTVSNSISFVQRSYSEYSCLTTILANQNVTGCYGLNYIASLNNPIGQWVHVVLTQQFHTVGSYAPAYLYECYINNVKSLPSNSSSEKEPPCVSFNSGGLLGCGRYLNGTIEYYQNYFKGTMDDVRFYNRVLSANEVQKLYNLTE